MGLKELWLDILQPGNNVNYAIELIKKSCNDIKNQEAFIIMRTMISLDLFIKIKKEWVLETYASRNEMSGLAWYKMGNWKLKGLRRDFRKGVCPLCYKVENAVYTGCNRTSPTK